MVALKTEILLQVEEDLKVVRQTLGLIPDETADAEAAVLEEVRQIFEPVKDQTWKTGRDNNRTP
jgi:hypothetical protein